MIKGVIFDFDGTLLNSLHARISAWKRSFADYGIDVSEETLLPLIGLPGIVLSGKFYSDPEAIEKREEEYFMEMVPEVSLFDDVEDTFSELDRRRIKTTVVTSSRRHPVYQFVDIFHSIITIDDVTEGKPNPEPYLKAMERMGIKSNELVVVGDSENDMIPARKVNAVSVMVRHGIPRQSAYADYYIEEIHDVLELIKKVESRTH